MTKFDEIRAAAEAAETLPPVETDARDGVPDDRGAAEDPPAEAPPIEAEAARFPLNDYGNGQRLVAYYGADMQFVPRLGWYRWQGKRWAADEDELLVRRDAQMIAGRILGEIPHLALEPWEVEAIDRAEAQRDQLKELEKVKSADITADQLERLALLRRDADRAAAIRAAFAKRKAEHRSHAKNSGNTSKISNMLLEAKPERAIGINDLNADPLALNCATGTLFFRRDVVPVADPIAASFGETEVKTGVAFCDHAKPDLISKLVPVAYVPGAKRPKWDRFLETVQPDPAMRQFLKRWFGYSITGLTSEQKLVFLYGGGRNGKSTLVDTIARVLADYGSTVPIETLTGDAQRKGSDATPDLVRLPGARMVRASEPEQGQKLKEALVKALTGGEAIMIRRMMQEFVEVTPEFKLTISGNHKPEIRGGDDGIWRRVLLVPFETQIAEAAVDPHLARDLWDQEREGIFAWLVEGCLDYLAHGLETPAAIKAATDDYRNESDPVRMFLTTECRITGGDEFTPARDLVDAFNAWMIHHERGAWGRRTVSNAIKQRAGAIKSAAGDVFLPAKVSDTGYRGISIPTEVMDRVAKYQDKLNKVEDRKG